MFDVSKPVKIGAVTVRDPHPLPHAAAVSVTDILAYSLQHRRGATSRSAWAPETQKTFLGKVGLLGGQAASGPQWASPLVPAAVGRDRDGDRRLRPRHLGLARWRSR